MCLQVSISTDIQLMMILEIKSSSLSGVVTLDIAGISWEFALMYRIEGSIPIINNAKKLQ